MTTQTKTHALVVAGSALWCLAILAAPLFQIHGIYAFFASICHQQAARSWRLFGSPLPVCIRCASIYFGFFAATLLALRPTTRGLQAAIAVTLTEFAVAHLLLDSAILRSLSGFALGAMVAPFVRIGIEEMLQTRPWKRQWKDGLRASL